MVSISIFFLDSIWIERYSRICAISSAPIFKKNQGRSNKAMEEKEVKKTENAPLLNPNDELLTEWAEKIYRISEETYKELLRLRFLMDKPKQKERFGDLMHEKQFGRFVFTFKSKSQLGLYLRIGDHEMATDYYPNRHHIEKIKNFLSEQGEKSIDIAQQILMQLAVIPIVGRLIRRNILYPEFEAMENKIAELKEKLKEKDKQLRFSLETWTYLAYEISSTLSRANSRVYAIMNEIGKE